MKKVSELIAVEKEERGKKLFVGRGGGDHAERKGVKGKEREALQRLKENSVSRRGTDALKGRGNLFHGLMAFTTMKPCDLTGHNAVTQPSGKGGT